MVSCMIACLPVLVRPVLLVTNQSSNIPKNCCLLTAYILDASRLNPVQPVKSRFGAGILSPAIFKKCCCQRNNILCPVLVVLFFTSRLYPPYEQT